MHERTVSLYRRLLLFCALACPLLLTAGLGWMAHRSRLTVEHSVEDVRRTLEIKNQLSILTATLVDAETGQRGFLLTGLPAYLAPYDHALGALPGIKQRLSDLFIDARAKTQFAALQPSIQAKLDFMRETIELYREGHKNEAQQRVLTGRGKELMDAVREQLARLNSVEDGLLQERQSVQHSNAKRSEILSWALLLLALGAVVAAIYFMRHLQTTQQYIKMCAFSRTLEHGGEWVTVEQFLEERFNLLVSHGISPEEAERLMKQRKAA